jgi:hypothetical protein
MVPFDRIENWEALFRKYDRLEREVFCHAMNCVVSPQIPAFVPKNTAKVFPAQMKPLPEIVEDIEAMRKEFSQLTIF